MLAIGRALMSEPDIVLFDEISLGLAPVAIKNIYAAVGIDLSLIFGIVRMVNLAHGDLMILSSYLLLTLIHLTGIHPYLLLAGVIPVMFVIGFGLQFLVLNRVLGKGTEPPLIVKSDGRAILSLLGADR